MIHLLYKFPWEEWIDKVLVIGYTDSYSSVLAGNCYSK